MLHTLLPLNDLQFLDEFIRNGADEFYIGFYDNEWDRLFPASCGINRMSEFGNTANQYCFEDCVNIVKMIRKKEKKVFITFNSSHYSQNQLDYSSKFFEVFAEYGASGIIVSNVDAAKKVVSHGLIPVASTMCGIYNSEIAQYYYDHGMQRMILPRDLSLDEIEAITDTNRDAEYEVFFMRNGCRFSDAFCLGKHKKPYGSLCSNLRSADKQIIHVYHDFENRQEIDVNHYMYDHYFHNYACGQCALYRLNQMNVSSLKFVGRADNPKSVLHDLVVAKNNIQLLNQCTSESEYLAKMAFPNDSSVRCLMGLGCYYPEVRFH